MATLALSAIGAAAGSALLPSGLSVLGTTLTGAALGSQLGSLAGSQIDQALFGSSGRGRAVDGPRLSDLHIMASTEGAAIPRLYGHARIGGQLIWATSLVEEAVTRQASGSSKGGSSRPVTTGTDYVYYANFAVALCEGEITSLGRVWADGREIDISNFTTRLYTGTQTQLPDPFIEAKQDGVAPAYRGLAYIVFEHLPLASFGNRIPQLSFEISRAVDHVAKDIRGVCLIPGSGEFVYAQDGVNRKIGRVRQLSENVNTRLGGTDWSASLDQLQSALPNAKSISLVVSWFGNDLRAGDCQIRPLVESNAKVTTPVEWSVAGLSRSNAQAVTQIDDRAVYGGTPSDQTVTGAIADLNARGLSVVFSPFILMDIPAGNALPDPCSGASSQPTYPWRGRITVSPAAGQPATADKTAAAQTQLSTFIGSAQPSNFTIVDGNVVYSGPAEWSFRRFILHNAFLCAAAGGVDAFVLCSELRGLTTARASATSYPFVAALIQLATEVRVILGPTTKVLYAADWSEYFGHQPADGSGDVHFHLDPLWAAPAIDAIGVDVYWPLADWRDGASHLDARAGAGSIHELDYLKSNLIGGEGFDWYYASDADRLTQTRSLITDGAGKPWMFRYKDLKSWWQHPHFNRVGGVETTSPTAWVPQSKPFWFMEIGCPAVDKGANQPNVFIDPKSSESLLPHFSSGTRDDFMQRRVLQAFTEGFDPNNAGYVSGLNPISALTGQRMVDVARTHVYAWDARPYPAFPNHPEIWGDAGNWRLGHWINGRITSAPIQALVSTILNEHGFAAADTTALTGTAAGFVVDRIMSARQTLQPLELGFFFDAIESDGTIVFRPRAAAGAATTLNVDNLVETRVGSELLRITRGQETDLPASAKINYISDAGDYPQAVAEARRIAGASGRVSAAGLGVVLDPTDAVGIAESWLFEAWAARERARFALPPSRLAIEPGDIVAVETLQRTHILRVTDVGDHGSRDIDALTFDAAVYQHSPASRREKPAARVETVGQPLVIYLDIPPGDGIDGHRGLVAAAQEPWPGTLAVYRSPETTGFAITALVARAAVTGLTTESFTAGATSRIDYANTLTVAVDSRALQSVAPLTLFAGGNTAAVEVSPNVWEVLQFQSAQLVAPLTYRLTGLLRGARGTEPLISALVPTGARFVLLDESTTAVTMTPDEIGLDYNWRTGPAKRDIGDPSYIATTQRFTGQGLKPLTPVHIRATRNAAGDLTLSWVRRTRNNGDSWDTLDVPLGETAERYDIDILSGATIKRTLTAATTTATYTAADQIADFGAAQLALTIRTSQTSPTFGRGHTRTHTL